MRFIRRHSRLFGVAAGCIALGAGASAIASAGAAPGSTTTSANTPSLHKRAGDRRLLARAVHGDVVVATKAGFVTVTLDRGFVQSIQGQQLTLREGTKKATYKTVTLTIPASARVRDDGRRATLADLKQGQRASVVQGPKRTLVVARDARA